MASITVGLLLLFGATCCFAQGYQSVALKVHNEFRAKHHAPALSLDNELFRNATRCAQYYASMKILNHKCPYKNNVGENLAWVRDTDEGSAATQATNNWYNKEVAEYSYDNPGFTMKTGHFTQVVWKSSTKLGIGVYRDRANKRAYVCALYGPSGNYPGEFPDNVLRP